jgi:hypothetical protein
MDKKWLTIQECVTRTGKSINTIRNWITRHDNGRCVAKDGTKYIINIDELKKDYPLLANNDTNNGTTFEQAKEAASIKLYQDNQDKLQKIIDGLVEKDKIQSEHMKKLVHQKWIYFGTIIATIVIIILFVCGYFYKKELTSNNTKNITSIVTNHKKEIKSYDSRINLLNSQIMRNESLYKEVISSEQERAGELKEQIKTLRNRETALIIENKLLLKQSTDTQREK